jgi:hypothetical protein
MEHTGLIVDPLSLAENFRKVLSKFDVFFLSMRTGSVY